MWFKAPNGTWWNINQCHYVALNEDSPTSWYVHFFGPVSIPQIGPYADQASAQTELDRIVEQLGTVLAV